MNRATKLAVWQYAAVGASIVATVLLARYKVWPFGTSMTDLGENPSVWEVMLLDRVLLGYLRLGVVAVVVYVGISVPALILARRWMKGLSTAGLTADDAETSDKAIETLQSELRATENDLQDSVARNDMYSQYILQLEQEIADTQEQGGGAEDDGS